MSFFDELTKIAEDGFIPLSTPATSIRVTPFGEEKPDKKKIRLSEGAVKTAFEGSSENASMNSPASGWEDDRARVSRTDGAIGTTIRHGYTVKPSTKKSRT